MTVLTKVSTNHVISIQWSGFFLSWMKYISFFVEFSKNTWVRGLLEIQGNGPGLKQHTRFRCWLQKFVYIVIDHDFKYLFVVHSLKTITLIAVSSALKKRVDPGTVSLARHNLLLHLHPEKRTDETLQCRDVNNEFIGGTCLRDNFHIPVCLHNIN